MCDACQRKPQRAYSCMQPCRKALPCHDAMREWMKSMNSPPHACKDMQTGRMSILYAPTDRLFDFQYIRILKKTLPNAFIFYSRKHPLQWCISYSLSRTHEDFFFFVVTSHPEIRKTPQSHGLLCNGIFQVFEQSEKFQDLGTLTWRGADLWVQWCLHAILRDFEVGKSWSYIWLNAGLTTKVRV